MSKVFDSRTARHMWADFAGSLTCSEGTRHVDYMVKKANRSLYSLGGSQAVWCSKKFQCVAAMRFFYNQKLENFVLPTNSLWGSKE